MGERGRERTARAMLDRLFVNFALFLFLFSFILFWFGGFGLK
jgi:hypothetical protein